MRPFSSNIILKEGERLQKAYKWIKQNPLFSRGLGWIQRGSNPPPRRCERRALPDELWTHANNNIISIYLKIQFHCIIFSEV